MRNTIFILFILLAYIGAAQEQAWEVPAEANKRTAPSKFTDEQRNLGEKVYMGNCKSCHGDPGQHNMIQLIPQPKDLSTMPVEVQSDGSLYYKITEGRGPMPSFKNSLSPEQVWQVISYVRSFHKDYVQPEPTAEVSFTGNEVSLSMVLDSLNGQLKITSIGKKDGADIVAEGVPVLVFVKRNFGQLPVGNDLKTDSKGEILLSIPADLPGDKDGNIHITAKVAEPDKYGSASASGTFALGVPVNKPGITEQRAMWNVRTKAPLWVMLSYSLVVIAVFGVIGYILLLLKKVNELGKFNKENN